MRQLAVLFTLTLASCSMGESRSFPFMTGVDRIVIGHFKYKNMDEAKGLAINDKRLIDEIVAIANLKLSQQWKPFVGVISAKCGINLHFYSGTSYLGNLAFKLSDENGSTTMFTLSKAPKHQIYWRQDASTESQLLRKIIGNATLQEICPN